MQYPTIAQPQYAFAPTMPMMAEGGLAAAAAAKAQEQGRGGDSMLVHMSPGEVKGLQSLAMAHGGSLTINPSTGLPEAGFLQRILPTLLGAGLSFIPGVGPLMAAGIVGGGYGIAKGSLKEGLMAGLGAYGGAGLASGLTAAGATTTQGAAATEAARQAAGQTIAEEAAKNAALEGITLPADYANLAASTATPAQIAAQQGISGNLAMAARGPEALLTEQGRAAFMGPQGMGAAPYSGYASTVSGLSALTPEPKELPKSETHYRPYEFAWNPDKGAYDPSPTPGDSSERTYFSPTFKPLPIIRAANGGIMGLMRGGTYDDEVGKDDDFAYAPGGDVTKPKSRSISGKPHYKFAQNRRDSSMEAAVEQNFAKGGLGAALPPRFLQGGGDGMSDSIKANIDGKQEARLADGEFVVPADVVSHLGNGSSKAGAKKLYAMMDKIRKARTGRERQAPAVNPNKYMPA